MRMRCKSLGAMVLVAAGLAACAVQAPPPPPGREAGPAGFPEEFYQQSVKRGLPVFEIDPAVSLVVIEVHRGGSLAKLGHDHAIASHNVRGYVAPSQGRADLFVRLDELVVDEPELRAEAGFESQPSAAAIAGTRENMLAELHADLHPYAVIAVDAVDSVADSPWLNASI